MTYHSYATKQVCRSRFGAGRTQTCLPKLSQRRHKRILLSLCLCAFVAGSAAQAPAKKLREFPINEVSTVSIDRLGNFYLVSNGRIRKYDTDGKFMNEFSNPQSYAITLLEPWNPLKIFVYARNHQEILFLDREMGFQQKIPIDPSLAIDPYLACPSIDNNFWLLDRADFSLKKIDAKTYAVLEEINLKPSPAAEPDFTFVREYQNLLFLIDQKEGIVILSIHGKPIHTLKIKGPGYIGFLGQEIYLLENGKITFYDLYTEEQHSLPVDPLAQFVLITDERMVLVKKSSVEVWEYKP